MGRFWMSDNHLTSEAYATGLWQLFKLHKNEKDADAMAKYMKNRFEFFGIRAPQRSSLLRAYVDKNNLPTNWREWSSIMWSFPEREMQMIGMEVIYRLRKKIQKNDIDALESIITTKSWWDSVDFIASNIIGYYFFAYPDQINPVCQRWSASKNMWLIRTSLLFQLKYKKYTDFNLLQQLIHQHKHSNEFFIQKAIGWALRQYAKTNADDVQAFVTETELKPLSRREALKHFN